MSWSARYKVDPGNIEDMIAKLDSFGLEPDEHKIQHDAALMAATDMLMSGALGSIDKTYTLSLSGHGNPGNEPVDGWANDFITVTVTQQ